MSEDLGSIDLNSYFLRWHLRQKVEDRPANGIRFIVVPQR